jgi:hypothetical protein
MSPLQYLKFCETMHIGVILTNVCPRPATVAAMHGVMGIWANNVPAATVELKTTDVVYDSRHTIEQMLSSSPPGKPTVLGSMESSFLGSIASFMDGTPVSASAKCPRGKFRTPLGGSRTGTLENPNIDAMLATAVAPIWVALAKGEITGIGISDPLKLAIAVATFEIEYSSFLAVFPLVTIGVALPDWMDNLYVGPDNLMFVAHAYTVTSID